MTVKIDSKIVGFSLADQSKLVTEPTEPTDTNTIKTRARVLDGKTYKIKPPTSQDALYVTLNNDMDGKLFEIFLNTKNTDHIQWTTALTRVISAVFRKGGDILFLANELRSVSDPNGGYFNNSRFVPSLISEVGDVIMLHHEQQHTRADKIPVNSEPLSNESPDLDTFGKTLCKACREVAVVIEGGCAKCLSCGESKCG